MLSQAEVKDGLADGRGEAVKKHRGLVTQTGIEGR